MFGNLTECNRVIQEDIISELKDILADDFPVLVTTYLEDSGERIARLEAAIADADAANIRVEAHSLKGSSSNLGATGLADLCSKLENCGAAEELDSAPILFSQIQSEFLVAENCLKQHLA